MSPPKPARDSKGKGSTSNLPMHPHRAALKWPAGIDWCQELPDARCVPTRCQVCPHPMPGVSLPHPPCCQGHTCLLDTCKYLFLSSSPPLFWAWQSAKSQSSLKQKPAEDAELCLAPSAIGDFNTPIIFTLVLLRWRAPRLGFVQSYLNWAFSKMAFSLACMQEKNLALRNSKFVFLCWETTLSREQMTSNNIYPSCT